MRPTPVRPLALPLSAASASSESAASPSTSAPSTPPDTLSPFSPRPPAPPPSSSRPASAQLSAGEVVREAREGGGDSEGGAGSGPETGEKDPRAPLRRVALHGKSPERQRSPQPAGPSPRPSASARPSSKRSARSPLPVEAEQPLRVRALSAAEDVERARPREEPPRAEDVAPGAFAVPKGPIAARRTANVPLQQQQRRAAAMKDVDEGEEAGARGGMHVDTSDVAAHSTASSPSSGLSSPIALLSLGGGGEPPLAPGPRSAVRGSLSPTPTSSLSAQLAAASPTVTSRSSKSISSLSSALLRSPTSSAAASRRPSAFSARGSASIPGTPSSLLQQSPLPSPLSASSSSSSSSSGYSPAVSLLRRREVREQEREPSAQRSPITSSPSSSPVGAAAQASPLIKHSSRVLSPGKTRAARASVALATSASSSPSSSAPPPSSAASQSRSTSASSASTAVGWSVPSRSSWFRMDSVHRIERKFFPEFFPPSPPTSATPSGSASPTHTAASAAQYKEYRDWMIAAYRRAPRVYLCFTTVRKFLHGDFGALYKIYQFLESWELLNYRVDESTRPSVMELGGPAVTVRLEPPLRRPSGTQPAARAHAAVPASEVGRVRAASSPAITRGGVPVAPASRRESDVAPVVMPVMPLGPPPAVVRPTAVSLPMPSPSSPPVPSLRSAAAAPAIAAPSPPPAAFPSGLPLRPVAVAGHPAHAYSHSLSAPSLPPLFPSPAPSLLSMSSFGASPRGAHPSTSSPRAPAMAPPLVPGRFVPPASTSPPLLPPLALPVAAAGLGPVRPTPLLPPQPAGPTSTPSVLPSPSSQAPHSAARPHPPPGR